MKKMILMIVLGLILTASPVFAHCGMCGVDGKKGDKKARVHTGEVDGKVKKMTKTLGLSEEQSQKVKAIIEAKMEKKKAVHEEMESKMNAIRDEFKASMKEVLTPEQMEKFEDMPMKGKKKGDRKHSKSDGHSH